MGCNEGQMLYQSNLDFVEYSAPLELGTTTKCHINQTYI